MPRLLFEKTGNAIWISHLDLMRVFQRAFKRAGLPLTHTKGFNPRPSVSIALPLSVGVESLCELLDFDLDGMVVPMAEIRDRLNASLIKGVRVLDVYEEPGKLKNLAYLDCILTLEYDHHVDEDMVFAIQDLFSKPSIIVDKKGKNGVVQQDIIPLIRKFKVFQTDLHTIVVMTRVCCQNPTLNPMQINAAIELYLPQCKPDSVKCVRTGIFDSQGEIFR